MAFTGIQARSTGILMLSITDGEWRLLPGMVESHERGLAVSFSRVASCRSTRARHSRTSNISPDVSSPSALHLRQVQPKKRLFSWEESVMADLRSFGDTRVSPRPQFRYLPMGIIDLLALQPASLGRKAFPLLADHLIRSASAASVSGRIGPR